MTAAATQVAPQHDWLSQGDVFEKMLHPRAVVSQSTTQAQLDQVPAMVVTHSCALDKKTGSGKSKLEWVTFVPIQKVSELDPQRAQMLRDRAWDLHPYEVMYLGDLDKIGESYCSLTFPYTLPAPLLNTQLKTFTPEETGDDDEESNRRIVLGAWDYRLGTLTPEALDLFHLKWSIHWTRIKPELEVTE